MKSRLAPVRAEGGLDRVNRAVQSLEDEWQQHGEVELEQFWIRERTRDPIEPRDAIALLYELIKAEMRWRFARGEAPTVSDYLERFPDLRDRDDRVLSLVYEEYCLNEECGREPDVDSFCNRYADWKTSLLSQLEYHRHFSQAAGLRPALPPFPEAGQDFEEFRLQSLLGSGGMSRVFLARDLSLGGKQVVLKVTLDRGQEPKVQGPLDHPHIVPVNSVAYQTDGRLCGLSMPYRPGLTLDELIPLIDPASRQRKAIALWHALVRGTRDATRPFAPDGEQYPDGESRFAIPKGDCWEGFPVRGTYAQGVAWVVMILARALHYAHRRQTFHRDVKPGNLLLTLQNGPQLLDFNLAESPHSANQAQSALHGGTLPYMAPEQIEAFINPDLWGKVGAKADVYSLGLVLRELLTGREPELPAPGLAPARALRTVLDRRPFLETAVRQIDPSIPHALEAIVVKCLAMSPADRYPDAQTLERDLDRFLRHLPLLQSANPSHRERVRNWAIRNRRALCGTACAAVVAATLCGAWQMRPAHVPERPNVEASAFFHEAVRQINDGTCAPAIRTLWYLETKNDHSSLVKFYLSMALDQDEKNQSAADRYLRRSLAVPGAEAALTAWSRNHSEVVNYLVDFAESRIKRADMLGEIVDNGNSVSDKVRDSEYREPTYELARDALKIASTLDTMSPKIQRLLARTEKMFGEYDSAYRRLSNLVAATTKLDPMSLYFCWGLRARVAFLWAEQDLRDGCTVDEATRKRLRDSVVDLDHCDRYLRYSPYDQIEDQALKKYHVLHDRVRTMVTSAAVDLRLSQVQDAEKNVRQAEKVLPQLIDLINARKLNKKVDDLTERLTDLKSRLSLTAQGP